VPKLEQFFEENQQNILPLLEEQKVNDIYTKVVQKLSIDKQSTQEKLTKVQDYMKLALLITEEKSYPFTGAANAMLPLVVNSVIQFAATAFPPLVQDDEIVKFKIIGKDDGKVAKNSDGEVLVDEKTGQPKMSGAGSKAERGKRVATMMNYQINEQMPGWKRDLYKYLMCLGAIGTVYKKVFYDSLNKKTISKFILPDGLIINDNISDMSEAIMTEILELSPQQVMENIRNGIFIDYDFEWTNTPVASPLVTQDSVNPDKDNNFLGKVDFRFISQYTFLDLDDDGFPEPYIVTCDLDKSKVVRIVPNYFLENVQYNSDGKVSKIEREQTFVDFTLIPSPDGGHLGMGFGHLLFNLNKVANGTVNQMLDAGHSNILGGGFIGKSLNIRGGRFAMGPREWKMVDNFGSNIRDSIVPLPTPEVSPVLFSLLGLLIESAKETGSLRDVLTGEIAANMAPTTYMGLVEQGLKQFLAIFKGIHDSMKQEFKLIRKSNARNLSDEEYARVIDEPELDVSASADFSSRDCDVVPVADPTSVTSAQKMAQAQIIQGLFNDPFYDQIKLRKLYNNSIQIQGLDDAVVTPQPQPDANLIFAQAEDKKANVKQSEVELKIIELQQKAKELDEKSIERAVAIENKITENKIKETQVLKNLAETNKIVSETDLSHKQHDLDVLTKASDAMTKRIEIEAKSKAETAKVQAKTQEEAMDPSVVE